MEFGLFGCMVYPPDRHNCLREARCLRFSSGYAIRNGIWPEPVCDQVRSNLSATGRKPGLRPGQRNGICQIELRYPARRLVCNPARELDSVMEFGLYAPFHQRVRVRVGFSKSRNEACAESHVKPVAIGLPYTRELF